MRRKRKLQAIPNIFQESSHDKDVTVSHDISGLISPQSLLQPNCIPNPSCKYQHTLIKDDNWIEKRLSKKHVENAPDVSTSTYDALPIESYGESILSMYSWKPGDAIGRTNRQVVPIVQFKRRGYRQGLGAQVVAPRSHSDKKRIPKPGDKEEAERLSKYDVKQTIKPGYKKPESWVVPGILVRVNSKSFEKGEYYKHKGVVLDSNGISIRLDDGRIVTNLKQSNIETVIPKLTSKNHVLMILKGRYQSKKGELVDSDPKTDSLIIRLPSEELITCSFDDAAQWCGKCR